MPLSTWLYSKSTIISFLLETNSLCTWLTLSMFCWIKTWFNFLDDSSNYCASHTTGSQAFSQNTPPWSPEIGRVSLGPEMLEMGILWKAGYVPERKDARAAYIRTHTTLAALPCWPTVFWMITSDLTEGKTYLPSGWCHIPRAGRESLCYTSPSGRGWMKIKPPIKGDRERRRWLQWIPGRRWSKQSRRSTCRPSCPGRGQRAHPVGCWSWFGELASHRHHLEGRQRCTFEHPQAQQATPLQLSESVCTTEESVAGLHTVYSTLLCVTFFVSSIAEAHYYACDKESGKKEETVRSWNKFQTISRSLNEIFHG